MESIKQTLMNNMNMNSSELENLMNAVNLNSSFLEATKIIRSNSQEGLSKSIKALKDRPSIWPELIIVN
jgi:hypothetical protein